MRHSAETGDSCGYFTWHNIPLLAGHLVSKFTRSSGALGILLVNVHNRVCDSGGFHLEGEVNREAPKKASRGHDKIGQSWLEVPIRLQTGDRIHMV